MADSDESSKTEEPTPRKLQDARGKGQVTQSQDLQVWASLAAGTLALAFIVPWSAQRLVALSWRFLERPEQMHISVDGARGALFQVVTDFMLILGPMLMLVAAAGVGCGLAQVGLIWAPTKLKPEPGNLSPLKGLQRMFSVKSLVDFAKGLLKVLLAAAILYGLVRPIFPGLEVWPSIGLGLMLARGHETLVYMAAAVTGLMILVSMLDYAWQRFNFMKQMRMTQQEVRDEHKQSEGDPQVKGRIRRLRQERSRQRMMAAVPTATVVVTNPTHYAVALAYAQDQMAAPQVVAKGVDAVAMRIRQIAEENAVPVVENPPLARALHASVEVGDEIPAEHYEAVAQVIGYVMRSRAGRR
jgi:flagellar biosynthesis protein FlhB